MRAWIVAIALVAACKGGKDGKRPPAAAKGAVLAAPKVEVATVLATESKPPFLFLVDETGAVRLAAAASWADLDASKLKSSKNPAPLDAIDRFTREEFAMGKDPVEAIASWNEYSSSDVMIDLASLEDDRSNTAAQDDPPPPEEEDKPDDGEEESGGTGTAIALEEGKMGKKDSDRAEGQYKMRKNDEDPQLARQQAIEQARNAGILGGGGTSGNGAFVSSGPPRLNDNGTPARVAQVTGGVALDGKLERFRVMVLASPALAATKLIEIVRDTDAAIAVSHAGKIRPLRLQFGMHEGREPEGAYWVEARVSTKSIVVEGVPDKAVEITDVKELAAAIDEVRKTRGVDVDAPVDVLVDPDVSSQRLVDLLVALDVAGVRTIGMGPMPQPEELARRGKRIPTATLGQPYAQGDLDKALIRKVVKSSLHKMEACYTKALANDSTLAGTVSTQFYILPTGKVAASTAIGVDPALSECVAAVIKTLEFPKPKGGGGVQVSYPFTFRP